MPPLDPPPRGAAELGATFGPLAAEWGLEDPAGAIARLDDPAARVVVAGQQPGLLGGPLFALSKAASAVGAARRLERDTGVPHVPVFWVAGEDHDLDEIRRVAFPGPGGETLELEWARRADRRPISAHRVDDELAALLEGARQHVAGRPFAADAGALVDEYRAGGRLDAAFARALCRLLAPWGLLAVAPEALREHAAPLVRRAIEEPDAVMEALRLGVARAEALGAPAPVPPRFPLFLLEEGPDGRRHHLEPTPGGFRVGAGDPVTRDELLRVLERDPARFSSGVLLRAVAQQALLPVTLAVVGPAEMAYSAQLGPLFDLFGLPATPLAIRLSATLIEPRAARALERLGIHPEGPLLAVLAGAAEPRDLILGGAAERVEGRVRALARTVEGGFEKALADAALPPARERKLRSSALKVVRDLERLASRTRRAAAERSEEELAAARLVWNHLFPGGTLQERRWNALPFLASHGREWIADLVAEAERDPFTPRHCWVYL